MNPVQRFFRRYITSTIGILLLFFAVNIALLLGILTAGYMSGPEDECFDPGDPNPPHPAKRELDGR